MKVLVICGHGFTEELLKALGARLTVDELSEGLRKLQAECVHIREPPFERQRRGKGERKRNRKDRWR